MNLRHIPSTGLAAPENANGVPFDPSHVYASDNLAADVHADVTAEASGRALATRLYGMSNDPGMRDQEVRGETAVFPISNSFLREQEANRFSCAYFGHRIDKQIPMGRWTEALRWMARASSSR